MMYVLRAKAMNGGEPKAAWQKIGHLVQSFHGKP